MGSDRSAVAREKEQIRVKMEEYRLAAVQFRAEQTKERLIEDVSRRVFCVLLRVLIRISDWIKKIVSWRMACGSALHQL